MRARAIALAILVLIAASMSCGAESWSGKCVGISDGDTLTVLHDGTGEKIRLWGVDAPEKDQPYSNVSKKALSALCYDKAVTVNPVELDQYGRTVAVLELPDYTCTVNEAMVYYGLAWWYRHYAPENTRLRDFEAEARQAKRGLWADDNPVPPWDYRRNQKKD